MNRPIPYALIIPYIIMLAVFWAGGYFHEADLIRQCKEYSTLKLWYSGYDVQCSIIEKDLK